MESKAGFFFVAHLFFFWRGQRLGFCLKNELTFFWGEKVGLTTSMVKSQDNIISNLTKTDGVFFSGIIQISPPEMVGISHNVN